MAPRSPLPSADNLIVPAVKYFGPGILVAVVFGWSTVRIYDDLTKRNQLFVDLLERQIEVSSKMALALQTLADQVEHNTASVAKLCETK